MDAEIKPAIPTRVELTAGRLDKANIVQTVTPTRVELWVSYCRETHTGKHKHKYIHKGMAIDKGMAGNNVRNLKTIKSGT